MTKQSKRRWTRASQRFGTVTYEYMLTDSLWGVYQMIGKLNPRIYVLSR
jgi:hypothetical protein